MNGIYLDNSATTALCESAKARLSDALDHYGNPSSLHFAGVESAKILQGARDTLISSFGVRPSPSAEYGAIFTSCGTEANNLALRGVINAKNRKFMPKIITTDSEHPSILETLSSLEREGKAEVVRLATSGGSIDEDAFLAALDERTVLVSIMRVNNETGAVYDVPRLFELAKAKNPAILTHTDMTQAYLKVQTGLKNVDMATISGHKIHAPKGVAALIVKSELVKKKSIVPIMFGGGQESGFRSGTENIPGIAALHGAIEEGVAAQKSGESEKLRELREKFISALPDEVRVNEPKVCAPHIISITLPGIKSQTMLSYLSQNGICVSSGSACASHGNHKSYVLSAFGLSPKDADCTLRISLSRFTTEEELLYTAEMIKNGCEKLIRF